MHIIFAPAKTFNDKALTKDLNLHFKEKTKDLVKEIASFDEALIAETFQVSAQKVSEIKAYYEAFFDQSSFLAISLFMGESYKFLDYYSMREDAKKSLNERVTILDALYGVIKPHDGISKYRLDFTFKRISLKKYWKNDINQFFIRQGITEILSLASKEFSSLVDQKMIKLYEVSFHNIENGKMKTISVFNKQYRGLLLRYIIEHNIRSLDDLPNEFFGYIKNTKNNQIRYIK